MTAKEMFERLGYTVEETKDSLYCKDVYENSIEISGQSAFISVDGERVEVLFDEIKAIYKFIEEIENETSFDLDEAVARATLGNPKFKKHE